MCSLQLGALLWLHDGLINSDTLINVQIKESPVSQLVWTLESRGLFADSQRAEREDRRR